MRSKTDENEEDIKNGDGYEPIDCVWMFKVFKSRYQEPHGVPVVRIAKQLDELETVIYRELGVGCATREVSGIW